MTAKMNASLAKSLKTVYATLEEVERYQHASRVLGFDQQTICPPLGMEEQGETSAFLSNKAFRLSKSKKFISAALIYVRHQVFNTPHQTILKKKTHPKISDIDQRNKDLQFQDFQVKGL